MKIQCACGTKIAFDVTPEMATNPVQFVCPNCGLDSSSLVNQLIRQELGVSSASTGAPAAAPVAAAVPPPPAPAPVARPAMRVATPARPAAAASSEPPVPMGKEFCVKHPGKEIGHKCIVCGKPMCPECMRMFGYVCSPLCRNKAESRGQAVPVYALQKDVVEARRWRKRALVGGGVGGVLALLAGFWFWYAWFGSVPKVAYSYKFPDKARVGSVQLAGTDQLIYLHGGELGRIDMKQPQPVWTVQLVNPKSFEKEADATIARLIKARDEAAGESEDGGDFFKIPSRDELIKDLAESAMARLQIYVAGQNVWVASDNTLTQHDWQTGRSGKTIKLEGSTYGMRREGDELLLTETSDDLTTETVQRINLATGDVRTESSEKPLPPKLMSLLMASANNSSGQPGAAGRAGKTTNSTVNTVVAKVTAANEARRPSAPLDPQKIAGQAGNMSYAAKLALPALIANARNQQRLFAEMADRPDAPVRPPTELDKALEEWDNTQIVPAADGLVQFTRTLIERKIVVREAMKAPPKKSALNGNVSAADSMAVANEMLNEMQRERGSTVTENLSRYRVTVKRANSSAPVWSDEVTGEPAFHPLQTLDIITAGTTVIALDHDNKKLWQGVLNYPVPKHWGEFDDEGESDVQTAGLGPCVERGDTVYIYDQGSLAAFDRATGEARWRLPSVGISGLWFDEKGAIYVNTTTASPDAIRYSKQIDLSNQTLTQIIKVDPKTGKTLWSREGAKHICYLWKKYIYTMDENAGPDPDGEGLGMNTGLETPAFIRIRRIDAGSGRILWEHVQKRCPIDLHFHENTIQLMFRNEVQELKFLVL